MGRPEKNDWTGIGRGLALILQLGLSVLAPVFLCLAAGLWLQEHLAWSFAPVLLLTMGILAGGRNGYVLARNYLRAEEAGRKRRENRKDAGDE